MTTDGARSKTGRRLLFAVIAAACSVFAIGYVAYWRRARASTHDGAGAALDGAVAVATKPHVMFRHARAHYEFGRLAVSSLDAPDGARAVTQMACARVHYASGRGLCLEVEAADLRRATLHTFGRTLEPRWSLPLEGIPSRVRVSPDGRYGAATLFIVGHSYSDGAMSTRTLVVDLESDRIVADDLEKFEVSRDGRRFDAADLNVWGVTFARDSNRFYATVGSGGAVWLVAGDLAARRLETLREDVECPSLSPDGRRIAFKKRMTTPGTWRLHVLDLATRASRMLAGETRFIDDQVEWLDDANVLYRDGRDVYELAVDETSGPRVFLRQASSPAIVRRP